MCIRIMDKLPTWWTLLSGAWPALPALEGVLMCAGDAGLG